MITITIESRSEGMAGNVDLTVDKTKLADEVKMLGIILGQLIDKVLSNFPPDKQGAASDLFIKLFLEGLNAKTEDFQG